MSDATPSFVAEADTFTSPLPNIVFEESDREVVVVDLVSGVYYFLTGSGAYVWLALQSGLTASACSAAISAQHPDAGTVEPGIIDFVEELLERGLLQVADGPVERGTPLPSAIDFIRGSYRAPSLESFADLQDILLLDPVHDVDPAGWPHGKA